MPPDGVPDLILIVTFAELANVAVWILTFLSNPLTDGMKVCCSAKLVQNVVRPPVMEYWSKVSGPKAVKVLVEPAQIVVGDAEAVIAKGPRLVIVFVSTALHPTASVTVTVYAPANKLLTSSVNAPFDQR